MQLVKLFLCAEIYRRLLANMVKLRQGTFMTSSFLLMLLVQGGLTEDTYSNHGNGVQPPWGHANWQVPAVCSKKGSILKHTEPRKNVKTGVKQEVDFQSFASLCGSKTKRRRGPKGILHTSTWKKSTKHQSWRRVVGGKKSERGEWPWLVAVGRMDKGQQCGGTLISPHWVLTAAHCFKEPTINPCDYNVRLGEHHLFDPNEEHIDITPDLIIKHPRYKQRYNQNDIALVRLSKEAPLKTDNEINVVCMPYELDKVDLLSAPCTVAGWGIHSTTSYKKSYEVRHVSAPILSRGDCFKVYGLLPRGQFCAGHLHGGSDSCQGDSGGPLVCEVNGHSVLIGVVSWGEGCAEAGRPGVYSAVAHYMTWITQTMQEHPHICLRQSSKDNSDRNMD